MTQSSPDAVRGQKAAVGGVFDRAAEGYDGGAGKGAVPDGATWWDEQWTHGRRAQLEQLGVLDATRDRVVAAVDRSGSRTARWRGARPCVTRSRRPEARR